MNALHALGVPFFNGWAFSNYEGEAWHRRIAVFADV